MQRNGERKLEIFQPLMMNKPEIGDKWPKAGREELKAGKAGKNAVSN